MAEVLNKYAYNGNPADVVYIGRPSKWGNPFQMRNSSDEERNRCVDSFEAFIDTIPGFREEIRKELRGKNLICFCAPKRCHGDVLFRIANED